MPSKLSIVTAIGFIGLFICTTYLLIATKPVDSTALPSPPLKELAIKHNLAVGNFAIGNHLDDPNYTRILTTQFDFATIDNTPNWYFTDGGLRPGRTEYNFKQMDEIMSFAKQNDMPVQAHHYVWGEEKWLPSWLKNGNYTPEQLSQILQEHITTVGSHYQGQIKEWTVVNEAFTRGQNLMGLHDWWADHIGNQSYIDQSFIWARQADPSSKLILNDFNNEIQNSTSNAMFEYIKSARSRGVPIDGLGMQMHIDGSHPPKKEDVIANMQRFKSIGVDTYITEFDVNMHDVPASASTRQQVQAKIYYEMMRACIESGSCHSFALLGITDSETWYNYIGLEDAAPLPFDREYRPKPAYFAIHEALAQN